MKLLTEKFVQDAIVEFLFRKGWSRNLRAKQQKEHGVLRRLPYDVCDKLNLYCFFVGTNGKVELYDWRKIKAANCLHVG